MLKIPEKSGIYFWIFILKYKDFKEEFKDEY